MAAHKKVMNVRRDARVALSLLGDKTNAKGLREYVVIYGTARVTEGGAVDSCNAGPDLSGTECCLSTAGNAEHSRYITRITPSHFAGVGPWNTQGAE